MNVRIFNKPTLLDSELETVGREGFENLPSFDFEWVFGYVNLQLVLSTEIMQNLKILW